MSLLGIGDKMEQIVNLSLAEEQVLQKVKQLLSMIRRTVAEEPIKLEFLEETLVA